MNTTPDIPKRVTKTAVTYCYLLMLVMAIAQQMYSTLLPYIKEQYNLTLTQTSYMSVISSALSAVFTVVSMVISDRLNKALFTSLGCIVYGAAMFMMGNSPYYFLFLCFFALMNLARNVVNDLSTSVMSDLYGENRGAAISKWYAFFSLCGMIAPISAAWLVLKTGSWGIHYMICGTAYILIGILFMLLTVRNPSLDSRRLHVEDTKEKIVIPFKEIFTSIEMICLIIYNFVVAGSYYHTNMINSYLTTWDPAVFTVSIAAGIVTAHSVAIAGSRVIFAALRRVKAEDVLILSSVLSAVLQGAALFIKVPAVWFAMFLIVGLVTGANYTFRIVLACNAFPKFSATTIAISTLSLSAGTVVIHYLLGVISDNIGYKTGMMGSCLFLLFSVVPLIIGYKLKKKEG